MKKHYIAVVIEENGKYYSYVLPVSENDNLLSALKIKNITSATMCSTKKRAAEIVTMWNETFKQTKTFLFDTPLF